MKATRVHAPWGDRGGSGAPPVQHPGGTSELHERLTAIGGKTLM